MTFAYWFTAIVFQTSINSPTTGASRYNQPIPEVEVMSIRIVVLDGHYANPGDLSWEPLEELGSLTVYPQTAPEEVLSRAADAQVLVVNKVRLDKALLKQLPALKLICISATGTDNVDLKAAKALGIGVKNAAGYSTHSVVQHVFALIFSLTNKVAEHHEAIRAGAWNEAAGFSFTLGTIPEIRGKSIGIYGFGAIGKQVALLAYAFGMKVFVVSKHASAEDYPFYRFVTLQQLFETCDFVSLHAPLSEETFEIVNASLLSRMKPTAYLINTARGGLIDEADLVQVLQEGRIAGAALDVLSVEPPASDHPLFGLKNCILTPHIAWASRASRRRLIEIIADNIREEVGVLQG